MAQSAHHDDVPWCTVGDIQILYHTTISVDVSVQYDQRTVFGSHGAYAVWTGTDPRTFSLSANLVGSNTLEIAFNIGQVKSAYEWTQESPPKCQALVVPTGAQGLFNTDVRIESYNASIPETVHLQPSPLGQTPIQIDFSLGLKECKAI